MSFKIAFALSVMALTSGCAFMQSMDKPPNGAQYDLANYPEMPDVVEARKIADKAVRDIIFKDQKVDEILCYGGPDEVYTRVGSNHHEADWLYMWAVKCYSTVNNPYSDHVGMETWRVWIDVSHSIYRIEKYQGNFPYWVSHYQMTR